MPNDYKYKDHTSNWLYAKTDTGSWWAKNPTTGKEYDLTGNTEALTNIANWFPETKTTTQNTTEVVNPNKGGITINTGLGSGKDYVWPMDKNAFTTKITNPSYSVPGEEPVVDTEKKPLSLEDLYRQNQMLYAAQIPLQARALFQRPPVVPDIPYGRTYAAESVSNVAPATAEVNRQAGMANAIGASLGKYGSAGLAMMPGVIANTNTEVNKNMSLIGEAENKRINDQLTANAVADTANSTAAATAELQRLQLQMASNTASQTEKAKAITGITDILTKMANQRTDYYDLASGNNTKAYNFIMNYISSLANTDVTKQG